MVNEKDYEALCQQFLAELIETKTANPPGNEILCAMKVQSILGREGIVCRMQKLAPDRVNLYTDVINGDPDKPAVVLTGHMDVVPAAEGWNTDPYQLTEEGTRLYGRGSCDMKGGLAAMLAAAAWAQETHQKVPFRLAFVADEEVSGNGTILAVESKVLDPVKYAVIGEPTLNHVHIAHRGAIRFRITLTGRSCHGSKPQLGLNPIDGAAKVTTAVQLVNEDLKKKTHEVLPAPTMCVTTIHSEIKDNIVPEVCVLTVDSRPSVGDTAESFETLIREKVAQLGGLPEGMKMDIEPFVNVSCGYVEKESQIVRWAEENYQKTFGESPVVEAFPACCDQVHFTDADIPAILYGPGSIDQAHTANEYVEKDELIRAFRFYCSLLSDTEGN